jgi:hypothetical protein
MGAVGSIRAKQADASNREWGTAPDVVEALDDALANVWIGYVDLGSRPADAMAARETSTTRVPPRPGVMEARGDQLAMSLFGGVTLQSHVNATGRLCAPAR